MGNIRETHVYAKKRSFLNALESVTVTGFDTPFVALIDHLRVTPYHIRCGMHLARKSLTLDLKITIFTEPSTVKVILNSKRFQDQSPREVYATLIDESQFLCSYHTMYWILVEHAETRERRNQLRHPEYKKPELLASRPNQLWSWDFSKLRGPAKWTYFYLYVIIDVFNRYLVDWMIGDQESAALAYLLIVETCERQGIPPAQLPLYADRGSLLLAYLIHASFSSSALVLGYNAFN